MSGHVLGIDLGTTNSVVAVADASGARVLADAEGFELVPSVVSFHPSGEVLVGRTARERRLLDARNTVYSIKRLIGRPFRSMEVQRAQERFPFELQEGPTGGVLVAARNETYTLSEVSAFVLREVRNIAEQALKQTCTRAVVTVPANFNELQRSATKAAGRVAGIDVLRILNEPTAAALAYGYGRGSRERIAIYDLGGGTFDITLIELSGDVFEVLATAGDTYLGGDDIDVLIADQMAEAFLQHHRYDAMQDPQAYERLRAAAEWAKCQLSTQMEVQLRIEELAYGEGGASLDLGFGLSRESLERMTQPLVARTFDVCEDAMRVAGVRPTQLDNVILVGGSTRMPMVHGMVREYFGRKPLTTIDPDLVVAQGAAIQGAALMAPAERQALGRVRLRRVRRQVTAPQLGLAPTPLPEPGVPPEVPSFEGDDTDTVVRGSPLQAQPAVGSDDPTLNVTAQGLPPPPDELGHVETVVRSSQVPPEAFRGDAWDGPTSPGGATGEVPTLETTKETTSVAPAPADRWDSAPAPPGPLPPPVPRAALPVVAHPPPVPPAVKGAQRVPPAPPAGAARPPIGSRTLDGIGVSALPPGARPPPLPEQRPAGPAFAPERAADPGFYIEEEVEPQAEPEQAPPAPAVPLLLDVTPQTLGIETVGGYCEPVINRNAAIPVERTRLFSTAKDNQETVSVRICQGESRKLEDNQGLGAIELSGLRPAPRGKVQIGVTFLMRADGTLGVRARDMETGREQIVNIRLVGGVSDDDVARMRERQSQLLGRR